MWSVAAAMELMIVVSLMGEQWSPKTPPESEAATIGFWEFGGAGGDPAFMPFLRIVFTPPVDFRLP